ncbi:response regulator transcription factor [Streptomyces sp. NPDC096310]|uniref:response regulator transcription factor n=1 Tax=Streptomyces sp. NPDC096310 TaxID=3366082 RepID=UPI0037F6A575
MTEQIPITEQERAVLLLAAEGYTNQQISRHLGISERAAARRLGEFTDRHGLRGRTHAVAYALRNRLIEPVEPDDG